MCEPCGFIFRSRTLLYIEVSIYIYIFIVGSTDVLGIRRLKVVRLTRTGTKNTLQHNTTQHQTTASAEIGPGPRCLWQPTRPTFFNYTDAVIEVWGTFTRFWYKISDHAIANAVDIARTNNNLLVERMCKTRNYTIYHLTSGLGDSTPLRTTPITSASSSFGRVVGPACSAE